MGPRLFCAALALALLQPGLVAQDGLRSASLPERTPMNPIPPPARDVFQAPPGTYVPHPIPYPGPVTGVYTPWDWPGAARHSHDRHEGQRRPTTERAVTAQPPATIEPARPAPVAVMPSGPPKTFYVIPGCYAGDRRPDPARLPPGCRISRLRTIPPVVSRVSSPRRG